MFSIIYLCYVTCHTQWVWVTYDSPPGKWFVVTGTNKNSNIPTPGAARQFKCPHPPTGLTLIGALSRNMSSRLAIKFPTPYEWWSNSLPPGQEKASNARGMPGGGGEMLKLRFDWYIGSYYNSISTSLQGQTAGLLCHAFKNKNRSH